MGAIHLTSVGKHFRVEDFLQQVPWRENIQVWNSGDHHIAANFYHHSGFNLCLEEEFQELTQLCFHAQCFISEYSKELKTLPQYAAERTTLVVHCQSLTGKALNLNAEFLQILGNHDVNLALVPKLEKV